MSANLCVEAHMRELLEQGFDVAVVRDATAAAISLAVGAGGAVGIKTTVLIPPGTMDQATKKTVGYRPPGH